MDYAAFSRNVAMLAVFMLGQLSATYAISKRHAEGEPEHEKLMQVACHLIIGIAALCCGGGLIVYLKTGAFYSWIR